jgi:hypothetical protein
MFKNGQVKGYWVGLVEKKIEFLNGHPLCMALKPKLPFTLTLQSSLPVRICTSDNLIINLLNQISSGRAPLINFLFDIFT